MVVQSTYPGKKEEDPPVTLSYLTENIYSNEVKNVVDLVGRMGYGIQVQMSSVIPSDAQNPKEYRDNVKRIKWGALEGPKTGGFAKACCTIS